MDAGLRDIAVVDLHLTGLENGVDEKKNTHGVQDDLCNALKTKGFVYIKNHGIPQEKITRAFNISEQYFSLPLITKQKMPHSFETKVGYNKFGGQVLGDHGLTEFRETYDRCLHKDVYPMEIPQFKSVTDALVDDLLELSTLLLQLIAEGLGLPSNAFTFAHRKVFEEENMTTFRMIHYPPIRNDNSDTIRCGAHTDFGTITLLLQDDAGGLQIRNKKGEWIDAVPVPGTILVNIGDLLEIWTGGELKATEHVIPTPTDLLRRSRSRYSLVLFLNPDMDVLVEPLTGDKEKYEPVNAMDHVYNRLKETYS